LSLPEPAPAPGKKGAPGVKEPVKRTKGPKPGSKEDPKREERLIRGKLENGLEKMSKYEEVNASLTSLSCFEMLMTRFDSLGYG